MREELLRSKMVAKKLSTTEFLEKLQGHGISISLAAYYRKKSGESDFTRKEILGISEVLNLDDSDIMDIFFDDKVS